MISSATLLRVGAIAVAMTIGGAARAEDNVALLSAARAAKTTLTDVRATARPSDAQPTPVEPSELLLVTGDGQQADVAQTITTALANR
jgi:hypothetical protein